LRFTPPKDFPEQWSEEDSILGDFLRTVADAGHGKHESDFEQYIPWADQETSPQPATGSKLAVESLKELIANNSGTEANLQFREAAKLGVDLLRGEDAA